MRKVIFALLLVNGVVYADNNFLFDVGSSKLNTTWNFWNKIEWNICNDNEWMLNVRNNYEGTALDNVANSFRDNEEFNLLFSKKIFLEQQIVGAAKYCLVADRNVGLNNETQLITGNVGFMGDLLNNKLDYKLLVGVASNKQGLLNSSGGNVIFSSNLRNLAVEDWIFSGAITGDLLFLNDGRRFHNIKSIFKISDSVTSGNNNVALGWNMQESPFVTLQNSSQIPAVEDNLNHNLFVRANGYINLWNDSNKLSYNFDVNNTNIRRMYDSDNSILYSKVKRFYNENEITAGIGMENKIGKYRGVATLQVSNRDEGNYVERLYNISSDSLLLLQNSEKQKDNATLTSNLSYDIRQILSERDVLLGSIGLTKIEYETPSEQNNDERDEVRQAISVEYRHLFSEILTSSVKLNYYNNHNVFLKKERSSQNNLNKILTLSFNTEIKTGIFYYNPKFELTSNYTIYDYELSASKPRSFSFRQIAYRDSLYIMIKDWTISERSSVRFYEQGQLFWTSFSEYPQRRNLEVNLVPTLYYRINDKIKIGGGSRFFYLSYTNVNALSGATNVTSSVSPEIIFEISSSKLTLKLDVWLEGRFKQNVYIDIVPNCYLNANYRF